MRPNVIPLKKPVILSERSESKNLPVADTAKQIFGAKILRLLSVTQDDSVVLLKLLFIDKFVIDKQ